MLTGLTGRLCEIIRARSWRVIRERSWKVVRARSWRFMTTVAATSKNKQTSTPVVSLPVGANQQLAMEDRRCLSDAHDACVLLSNAVMHQSISH